MKAAVSAETAAALRGSRNETQGRGLQPRTFETRIQTSRTHENSLHGTGGVWFVY